MLLANIVTSIKTKSPPAMHKSTINLNIINYYNYSKIFNLMVIHILEQFLIYRLIRRLPHQQKDKLDFSGAKRRT